jgi:hypothetical protein
MCMEASVERIRVAVVLRKVAVVIAAAGGLRVAEVTAEAVVATVEVADGKWQTEPLPNRTNFFPQRPGEAQASRAIFWSS